MANCTSATCQLDVGFSFSANGGGVCSPPQQLAGPMTLSWLANTSPGRMVGDYISTSYVGPNAFSRVRVGDGPCGRTVPGAPVHLPTGGQFLRGAGTQGLVSRGELRLPPVEGATGPDHSELSFTRIKEEVLGHAEHLLSLGASGTTSAARSWP